VTTVFLDTAGLLALWDSSDQGHKAATAAFLKLNAARARLVSTSYILLECGNAAARRTYRPAVVRLRQSLETGGLLIHPTVDDWTQAWSAYGSGDANDAGIVDHVSFAVMRRNKIAQAFTSDRHFKAAGFEVLF